MRKIIYYILMLILFLGVSFGYCGINDQGNKYCSYGDDCYEYFNKDGSYYSECNGIKKSISAGGYDKYDNREDKYYEDQYQQVMKELEMEKYYQEAEKVISDQRWAEILEQEYQQSQSQKTDNQQSSRIIYYCPSNSYMSGEYCYCKEGYKYKSDGKGCEVDLNYHCNKEFPGTVWGYQSKMCICPKGNPMGRSSEYGGCPITKSDCERDYGKNSYPIGFAQCGCEKGYSLINENGEILCREERSKIYIIYGLIGLFIYFGISLFKK